MATITTLDNIIGKTIEIKIQFDDSVIIKFTDQTVLILKAIAVHIDSGYYGAYINNISVNGPQNDEYSDTMIELGVYTQQEYDEYWIKQSLENDERLKMHELTQLKMLKAKYPNE